MSFSERMGLTPERQIQTESMDDRLRNRLYNFFKQVGNDYNRSYMIKYILDKMGMKVHSADSYNNEKIYQKFCDDKSWYVPYDIIEYALEYAVKWEEKVKGNDSGTYALRLNEILCEEKSGYRFVNGQFVPITDETELEEIKTAMHSEFDAVDTHISKALSLYSDRDNPDYENSIKESISAVESMCCIITGMTGGSATLGAALKKLEDNGVVIHEAMKSAFRQLYGYTSDENGIRHGGIDFKKAHEEDARYMLVSCSAFVNYLKDKYSRSKSAE